MTRQPRFLADAMLQRLARWLRVLDLDTRCHPEKDDRELVTLANREGRWLLTRDRHLVHELRPDKVILIARDKPLDQLVQVIETCRPGRPAALFRRCLVCNSRLRAATEAECRALEPDSSRDFNDGLLFCPCCQRLYWPGSHTRRMRQALARTLPEWFDPPQNTTP